jgi:hypothetical protein
MARSLNQKYFGNRNIGTTGAGDDNIGGQGVASITLGGVNNSNGYALNDPIEISAPNLPGGIQATAKVSALGASNSITAIEITEKGSGYTSVPTVTESVGGVQGTLTFTAVLTTDSGAVSSSTNQENAITPFAKTTSGGTSKLADIIRQVGARRFKVKTADGTAICALKDSAVSAVGEMTITATDSAGGTYFVTKITSRKITVTQGTGTQFATGASVPWSFAAPTLNQTLRVANA